MALESTIQANILKYLNGLKDCVAENVLGCSAQMGRPDINCCYQGHSYRIEVKSAEYDNIPTLGQILNLKRWARAGANCIVVWSVDEVKNFIQHSGILNTSFTGWHIDWKGQIYKGGHE